MPGMPSHAFTLNDQSWHRAIDSERERERERGRARKRTKEGEKPVTSP